MIKLRTVSQTRALTKQKCNRSLLVFCVLREHTKQQHAKGQEADLILISAGQEVFDLARRPVFPSIRLLEKSVLYQVQRDATEPVLPKQMLPGIRMLRRLTSRQKQSTIQIVKAKQE